MGLAAKVGIYGAQENIVNIILPLQNNTASIGWVMDTFERKQNHFLHFNLRGASYWLLIVFLTLPHMNPPYLEQIPAAEQLINILRVITVLIIVLWYILKRMSASLVVVLVAVWRFFLVSSTLVQEGALYNSIVESFSIIGVVLLYDAACNSRKATFLSAQLFCFELMIYINLITEILYPGGLYSGGNGFVFYTKKWFLGLYNTHTRYYFPALLFAWLYKKTTGKKLRAYLILTAILVSSIRVWSGGTLLSLGLIIIVYVLFKDRTHIFNYYNYWILHIIFFVFIVILKLQNYFIWLIDDILGKWASLIDRMNLWDKVIELILEAPVIGHGIWDSVSRTIEDGVVFGGHAHNMLLEILYQGGAIGLSLWIAIVIVAGIPVLRYRDSAESKIIATAFLGWCVHTLVEPYTTPFLMGMFVIAYHSNRELAGKRQPCRKRIRRRTGKDRSFKGQNA